MCDSYGVCSTAPSEALAPLQQWSVAELGDFSESLFVGGHRDRCPSGCKVPAMFNGSRARFASMGLDGAALHARLQAHSQLEALLRSPNCTVAERDNATAWRREFTTGLLPPEVDEVRASFAYFNRLHAAVHAAVQPRSPPPPPRAPPPPPAAPRGRTLSGDDEPTKL